VVGAWIAENLGPRGRIEDAAQGISSLFAFLSEAPRRLEEIAARLDGAGADESAKTSQDNVQRSPLTFILVGFLLALLSIAIVRWRL
jgi:hypothetical protein